MSFSELVGVRSADAAWFDAPIDRLVSAATYVKGLSVLSRARGTEGRKR